MTGSMGVCGPGPYGARCACPHILPRDLHALVPLAASCVWAPHADLVPRHRVRRLRAEMQSNRSAIRTFASPPSGGAGQMSPRQTARGAAACFEQNRCTAALSFSTLLACALSALAAWWVVSRVRSDSEVPHDVTFSCVGPLCSEASTVACEPYADMPRASCSSAPRGLGFRDLVAVFRCCVAKTPPQAIGIHSHRCRRWTVMGSPTMSGRLIPRAFLTNPGFVHIALLGRMLTHVRRPSWISPCGSPGARGAFCRS